MIRVPHGGAGSSQPVSREECAAMITEALQSKVGPALQAAFSQVGAELRRTKEGHGRVCSRAVVRYWYEVADEQGHRRRGEAECRQAGHPGQGKRRPTEGRRHGRRGQSLTALTEGLGDQDLELKPPDQDGARHHAIRAPPGSSTAWAVERLPALLRKLQEGVLGAKVEDPHPGGQGRCMVGPYPLQPQGLTGTTGAVADWKPEVQLPAEHKDHILECVKQQISRTEVEKEAFSSASLKTARTMS